MSNVIVSVIIVNYRSADLVLRCIQSIRKHSAIHPYEILVIDNASGDDSLKKLATISDKNIRLISNLENVGFGAANNIAIKKAKGNFLLLLNPDTYFLNDAIKHFLDAVNDPLLVSTGAFGAYLLSPQLAPNMSGGDLPSPYNLLQSKIRYLLRRLLNRPLFPQPSTEAQSVGFVSGACLFIRRSLFEELGGFDPKFFLYYEETDLQCRMHRLGYDRVIIPGPKIIHLEGASHSKSINARIYGDVSMLYYVKKHFGKGIKYYIFAAIYLIFPLTIAPRYSLRDNTRYFISYFKAIFQ
jgi:GT2 family glycosyltransferase